MRCRRRNGICLCVGKPGSRPDNDVVAMARGLRAAHSFRASALDPHDDGGKSLSFTEPISGPAT